MWLCLTEECSRSPEIGLFVGNKGGLEGGQGQDAVFD